MAKRVLSILLTLRIAMLFVSGGAVTVTTTISKKGNNS